ncbi:unnamed protein product [Fraxinus pennsylvanica]|uniref:Pentatricopeptide repeat-containing protein n=1 Tax=Fraxinus pennsylvanica TaxID=56036 RepID=A0AAD1ZJ51_9LAMI|nr:unnamed protein product [Fraxinus pennsylvanica]
MSIQKFIQNLKTVKGYQIQTPYINPKAKIGDTIISTILIPSNSQPIPTALLSKLTPGLVHLILSDPHLKLPKCLDFFNFLLKNQSSINFKLNLESHFILICRLVKQRKFTDAERLLGFFFKDEKLRMVDMGIEVSVFSLTVVVDGLCKNGEIKRAKELVDEMLSSGIKPNVITFNIMVNACTKRWKFEELEKILDLMKWVGVDMNVETFKFLVDGFSSCGKIEEAEKIVLEMHQKGFIVGAHLYNLVIHGYCRVGDVDRALSIFCKMKEEGICPNVDTYGILASHISNMGELETAKDFIKEMQSKGIE